MDVIAVRSGTRFLVRLSMLITVTVTIVREQQVLHLVPGWTLKRSRFAGRAKSQPNMNHPNIYDGDSVPNVERL